MPLVEPSGGGSGIDPTDFTTAVEALIRQRRRLYQKNYRKQEREQIGKLENDIRKIRRVIAVLAQNIQYLSIGISRSKSRWGAIMNYFRLFRKGFRSHTKTAQKCALHVLQSFMAPNVRDGVVCGPKGVLAGWTMFSLCFDDIYVDLRCLENGPIWNSVVATVITSITISKDSLRLVFPHLIEEQGSDGSNRSGQLLANKLLGQRLVMHGSVVFQWDNEMDRVSSMQSRSDLLTPLLRVLGNLEDVNCVLKGSLVTPDCTWPYNVQVV
ncbi:hypothetical protein PHMEG_00013598 [Phytophthora megakarya]|uniref:Bzip transcription factor n=1 Tax=Phytophthora megakarya TaxID=4795 RepID=A0A225W5Y5_9STRA|nr:hypothetical protein PHMEG_00013598 [Phytophthora megakarya]